MFGFGNPALWSQLHHNEFWIIAKSINHPILANVANANGAHFFGCLDADQKHTFQRLLAKLADQHEIHNVPTE
jgi:hypothetical protein